MAAFATIFTIMTILLDINITSGSRSRHQKNIGLVQSISSSQAVEEGSSVEFECRLGKIPDRAEVAWVKLKGLGDVEYLSTYRKDEGAMDYEEEFTSDMEKDGDEAVWSLTLFRVTKSMAGFYQCEVLLNDSPVSSLKVLLTVLTPKQVEHNTKYVITKLGGNVTLDCTDFEGEDVHWKRLGDAAVVQSGKVLSLIRVDRFDSGVYVCSVSGGSRTMNISLLVEHLPIVSTNQSTISVSPGHSTHLTCQVTAVPVPAVSWYSLKNNQEPAMIKSRGDLSISIKDYKDGRMTSSLILHNVTQDHYGGYSCNATNTEGEASAIISLVQPSNTSGGVGLWRNRNNLLVVFTVFIGWIKFH
eukprot:TRINITY_DN20380_c0_g1_i2.p1 TRINITY_DN20380_c0_g1~~TRINITY_DN20380_c0_g1_i2.p1  ORF type:complete len:357 (-),score=99.87 TRINITY_DN20380_c0_g1_i2:65-1135(-)